MTWNDQLDWYCERASTAFWAEPVNALSNLAFVIAALLTLRTQSHYGRVPSSLRWMAPAMAAIGVGSFLFHTLATRWSLVFDIVPIALFLLLYLGTFLRWMYGLAWGWCGAGVAAFAAFCAAFIVLVGEAVPNRSGTYAPVLLLMIGLTATLAASRNESRSQHWRAFAVASAVFAAAFAARTLDSSVCAAFSLGTHWLWHSVNGLLLLLLARVLIRRWHSLAGPGQLARATSDGPESQVARR